MIISDAGASQPTSCAASDHPTKTSDFCSRGPINCTHLSIFCLNGGIGGTAATIEEWIRHPVTWLSESRILFSTLDYSTVCYSRYTLTSSELFNFINQTEFSMRRTAPSKSMFENKLALLFIYLQNKINFFLEIYSRVFPLLKRTF